MPLKTKRIEVDPIHFWNQAKNNPETGCLEWQRAKTSSGYGNYWIYPSNRYAHRVAYQLATGVEVDGLHVCHKCDNPSCVNPDHLFLGTHQDNMLDKTKKGRARSGDIKGKDHVLSKLDENDVRTIRKLYDSNREGRKTTEASPYSIKSLAKRYGVAPSLIHRIVTRQSWPHVE